MSWAAALLWIAQDVGRQLAEIACWAFVLAVMLSPLLGAFLLGRWWCGC